MSKVPYIPPFDRGRPFGQSSGDPTSPIAFKQNGSVEKGGFYYDVTGRPIAGIGELAAFTQADVDAAVKSRGESPVPSEDENPVAEKHDPDPDVVASIVKDNKIADVFDMAMRLKEKLELAGVEEDFEPDPARTSDARERNAAFIASYVVDSEG